MLVGLGAAVVQGADAVTKDLDLWFRSTAHPGSPRQRSRSVRCIRVEEQPTACSPDRDWTTSTSSSSATACAISTPSTPPRSTSALAPGLIVKVLPIARVLASKRAADRPKDRAVIPALEAAIAAIKESSGRLLPVGATPIPAPGATTSTGAASLKSDSDPLEIRTLVSGRPPPSGQEPCEGSKAANVPRQRQTNATISYGA